MTKKELTELARQRGIKGYQTMSRAELEAALGQVAAEETVPAVPAQTAPAELPVHEAKVPVAPASRAKTEEAPVVAKAAAGKGAEAPAPERTPEPTRKSLTRSPATARRLATERARQAQAIGASVADPTLRKKLVPAEALAETLPSDQERHLLKHEGEGADLQAPARETWTNNELLIDEQLEASRAALTPERAVLLVRDPYWVYTYWDLQPETIRRARKEGGDRLTLRVHDVTDLIFDGHNSHLSFDLPMPSIDQRVWYLNVPTDGRTYLIQIGFAGPTGGFLPVLQTNSATTPRARLSEVIHDRFVSLDFEEPLTAQPPLPPSPPTVAAPPPVTAMETLTAQAPVAPTPSVPVEERRSPDISERMAEISYYGEAPWSGLMPRFGDRFRPRATSSAGLVPGAPSSAEFNRPAPPTESRNKDFWLVANCELVVYGATEPDAKVTVRGEAIDLRPDGSFTLRFTLPDGIHPIPIHATNFDGDMHRSIAFTVSRGTQVGG